MVTATLSLCSAFTHPKCTHTAVNTQPKQWVAIYAAAPGKQLGVRCLAQGQVSRGIEGGESTGHSIPPSAIPAGPKLKLATFGLRVQPVQCFPSNSHTITNQCDYFDGTL